MPTPKIVAIEDIYLSVDRIKRLINNYEESIFLGFLDSYSALLAEKSARDKVKKILQGRADEVLMDKLEDMLREAIANRIALEIAKAFFGTGKSTTDWLSSSGLSSIVSWNGNSDSALAQLATNKLDLIREFSESQLEATREALEYGIAAGLNPVEQARDFVESIGLTKRQVRAVRNYRKLLRSGSSEALDRKLRDRRFDPSVQAAVDGRRPLTEKQIDRMVQRYHERYLSYRARTIARTEALRSVNMGLEEAFNQAYESGAIRREDVIETWIAGQDERTRGSHRAMHRQQRQAGKPFLSGLGNLLRFPTDPLAPAEDSIQCRCAKTRRIRRRPLPPIRLGKSAPARPASLPAWHPSRDRTAGSVA